MSESPEEQQSTGVLGRIGSWLSPWRGKSPKSPTENASPTSDPALQSEGEQESEESVRVWARSQTWEENNEQSSDPNPLRLPRDILPRAEGDATQSAHRTGPIVSSTDTAVGGPKEEEFVACRKKTFGQGKEREEGSNHTSASGNPQKNASHLTHLSSSTEQGVVWDSDQDHTRSQTQTKAHAQTGRRLHVYLEETSVIQCNPNTSVGQEVVEVTKKNLKVLSKAKSTPSFGLSSSPETKRTNVRPVVGSQSYYSALVGVSLKSRKDSQSEAEPKGQTEVDSMGRKNAARRKFRKNSQGDEVQSPQEKTPPKTLPVPEGIPTSDNSVTSPQSGSANSHMGELSINSASKHNPTFLTSPEGVESEIPLPDTTKPLDNFQDSSSVTAAALACVVDGGVDMEDDSLYKVERKTETAESKRRSIKVSRSEVKLFTKNVPFTPKQSPAGATQEFKAAPKNIKDEEKETPKAEIGERIHDLKKIDEEPKIVTGRIADKISLFERPAMGVNKQVFKTPRSADVSPVRKVTDRMKEDFTLSEKRSRSAERHEAARSNSASPEKKPMSIKERARNFMEASRTALPEKPNMTGISQKDISSTAAAAKSPKLDHQGKLDTVEQIQKAKSEITLKPDGQDTTTVGAKPPIPKKQATDSKTNPTVLSAEQDVKPKSVETDGPAKGSGDSAELTNSLSPQSRGSSRTGSRSKRRKSREPTSPTGEKKPTSPISPTGEKKPTSPISPTGEKKPIIPISKPELTPLKQQQVDHTEEAASISKNLTKRASLPDIKQKAFQKESEVFDDQKKLLDSSFKKETGDRQEGLPEPSINKDEPDTAARGSGTKAPIDKEPVILPPKEEKAAGNSLTLTQREEKVSKDSRETSSSSSRHVPQQPVEKTCLMEQDPLVKNPKLEKDILVQAEAKRNKKHTGQTTLRPNKETELINQAESKDVDKLEKAESEKTNEEKNKETAQQLLHSNKDTRKVIVSEGSQSISGQEERTVRNDERKNAEKKDETQPVKVVTNPELARRSSDTDTSTHLPAQKQSVRQTKTTRSEKAVSTVSQTNELVRESVPLQAADRPSESKTKYAESPGTETETAGIAAKAQPQVSVEKTDSSLDDSCAHGGNDSQLLSSKSITKATKAAEKMTVKAGEAIPALIGTQTDTVSESESHVKESSAISVSGSESSTVAGQGDGEKSLTVKSLPSEVSGDVLKLSPRHQQRKESKNAESTSDTTALKSAEKIAQSLSDSAASSSSFKVQGEAAEKTVHSPVNEPSLVANGDISPKLHTVKKERVKSQTPKAPTLAEANKGIPALKMLSFRPRGLGKDDSSSGQDTPSSWLDVDFPKQKLKVAAPKLSSSGSESNLLDSPGELDDDFVERIKKLCAPFSLPPRKHSQLRPPQPPFAMPAIREDRFEKTFDPDEFKFGLRKNNQFKIDTTPGLMAAKNKEVKPGLKPARASLADRSMLLSILDTHSRLRDSTPVKEEEEAKEEKDDQVKVRSRLEGSCVFSGLTSSILRGKRNGVEAEGTNSGDVSPTEAPHLSPPPTSLQPPPSPTASHSSTLAPSYKEKAQAVETVVSDSVPPFPSFNDIKLPDYLEKYLPREPEKPVQSIQGQEQVRTEVLGKMTNAAAGGEAVKPGMTLPDGLTPRLPEIPPVTNPELKQPLAQPQGIRSPKMRAAKGFHKRPGKMVLFEKAQFSGQAHEIYRDVEDATSLQLSPLISVKVVRGCWVLYEKPDFKGRSIALEEGSIELTNMWAEAGLETEPQNNPAMQIGSIRLAVWDYSLPHIDLFTEPEGRGRVTPYHDDTIETGSFGIPLSTASIQVHSGVWLLFSDPGFQGMIAVLETGEYPFPETWGFPSPFVGSLRPLKMGGFKVENPNEIKAVVYEKPGFEGSWMEIDSDVFSFCESEDNGELDSTKLKSVGSLKIIGGLWVGYCEPGFEGQQFILEEGEYLDCSDWGGSEELCSLRPVVADFMSPHLKMFSDIQFGDLGVNIDITVPVIDMEGTGYGLKTQSIDVISGVWVVFEEPGFCGESYILEKGLYGCPEDWGGLQPRLASAMPVALDDFENAAKFNVQLFSEAAFQGSVLHLEDSLASLQDGVSVASCKVLAGSWMAFEGRDFTGRMYVLEVGNYPDLRAMGCTNSTTIIQSLQTVGFEFSLPSITLFERSGLRGKRTVLTDGSVNLQLAGGCSRVQSVLVEGGMWVLYEGINYRGPQILLKPGEVPDWRKFSSWQKIGSLRPLVQKRAYFRLRNRQSGLMMSLTGDLDDVKLMRIQETEETDGFEQIWFYQHGHLHCKLLEECCLSPSGSVTMAGSRVGLAPEPENQTHLWSITPEGFIRYSPTADLVLEVKGGAHYDKNQVILKTLDPHKLQQRWDVEIL